MISARSNDSAFPHKALVLGLGGGSVANALSDKGYQVVAVELDKRMAECAKKYFDLSEKVNVTVDDARHFVSSMKEDGQKQKAYHVIVLDAFIGEVNPHHLFTKEFFFEISSMLSDSGTFFINGNGFWNGADGKGMRSVCKTLLASGFDVELIPTRETEEYRNLLFLCRKSISGQGMVTSEKLHSLELTDDVILADDKPQLELLNAGANKKWREACMKYYLSGYYSGQDRMLFK
jgi:spermidine synthase